MNNERLKDVHSVTPEDEAMFFTATTLVGKVSIEGESIEPIDGHSEIFYG